MKVLFVKSRVQGSAIMRGDEICNFLKCLGVEAYSLYRNQIDISSWINDTIIIYVKHFDINFYEKLSKYNCFHVYDLVDIIQTTKNIEWFQKTFSLCKMDYLIYPSEYAKNSLHHLVHAESNNKIIYHHTNLSYHPYSPKKNKTFYFGATSEISSFVKKNIDECYDFPLFENITCQQLSKAVTGAMRCAYHINIRNALYKTSAKIAQAASVKSNIIISKKAGCVELLGTDYPYLCDNTQNSILTIKKKAIETFKSKEWDIGLNKMQELKEKLSLQGIVAEYKNLIDKLKGNL